MGIKGLSKAVQDLAPSGIKTYALKNLFGRSVAIDASMCLYQFIIAIRKDGHFLTSPDGETTSHIAGFFYRTIRLMEAGIRPVYVFDGKPPTLKSYELDKRTERRDAAELRLKEATDAGDEEAIEKNQKMLTRVTKEQNEDCKKLLTFMGVPFVTAPCEAEAQCAELCKKGKVFATATEDMDALTFGTNILLRHLMAPEAQKVDITEFDMPKILKEIDFTMTEFIDFCILLGCDYTASIKNVGPKRAFELIKAHSSIENILENLEAKMIPPENFLFKEARELFLNPDVTDAEEIELKWNEVDIPGIINFLCSEKGFDEARITKSLGRIKAAKSLGSQVRIDQYFKVKSVVATEKTQKKIKEEEDRINAKLKLKKGKIEKKPRTPAAKKCKK
uniref:Flap endonuclease 1 n=1 Tax=Rhabditophanes sp. KR3021 TaxID=114890 RepID=A0AC35TU90_9BILA